MKITSAYANKLLRKLNDEHDRLLSEENQIKRYIVTANDTEEDKDIAQPDYNFTKTQEDLAEIERKIRLIKHAICVFNTTTTIEVGGKEYTIDEALVLLPQLNARLNKYREMSGRQQVSKTIGYEGVAQYTFCNYEVADAKELYNTTTNLVFEIQTALDVVNNTTSFEVDVTL